MQVSKFDFAGELTRMGANEYEYRTRRRIYAIYSHTEPGGTYWYSGWHGENSVVGMAHSAEAIAERIDREESEECEF